jgi:hypothetical protein
LLCCSATIILINLLLFVFNLIPFLHWTAAAFCGTISPPTRLHLRPHGHLRAMWIFMLVAGGFIFRTFLYPLQSTFDGILAAL